MSQCDTCGKTVLVGMIEEGELRFCSEKCHEVGRFRQENPMPKALVTGVAEQWFQGTCPLQAPCPMVPIRCRTFLTGRTTGHKRLVLKFGAQPEPHGLRGFSNQRANDLFGDIRSSKAVCVEQMSSITLPAR